jgi:hypothetical protein
MAVNMAYVPKPESGEILLFCLFIEMMKSLILLIYIVTFMAWNVLNYIR